MPRLWARSRNALDCSGGVEFGNFVYLGVADLELFVSKDLPLAMSDLVCL